MARTNGYGRGTLSFALLRMAGLPRVGMGIAMCHFELAARKAGLPGAWVVEGPGSTLPGPGIGHTVRGRPA